MVFSVIFALAGVYFLIQRQEMIGQTDENHQLLSFGILGVLELFRMLGDFLVGTAFLLLGLIMLWNGVAGFFSSFITMTAIRIYTDKALFIAEILNLIWFFLLLIIVVGLEIWRFEGNIVKILLWLIPDFILGSGLVNAIPICFLKILHDKRKMLSQ